MTEGALAGAVGELVYKMLTTRTHYFKAETAIIHIAGHVIILFSFLLSPPGTH